MENETQHEFWTNDAGPNWVARMSAMDMALKPILDNVLRRAAIREGELVMDVGCGAGTSTLEAARYAGPSGTVCGMDISETLLQAARARAEGIDNIRFEWADAQTHPFAPAYDCMISRFGVMFFDDPPAAFANMAGALNAEGHLVFATWGAIPENPFFTLPARVAADVIGKAPKSDPDAPGPLSLRDVPLVTGLLEGAGLTDITAAEVPMLLTPQDDVLGVADMLCDIGSAQRVLSHFGSDPADRARLVPILGEALTQFETADGIRIPALINIFTARKAA